MAMVGMIGIAEGSFASGVLTADMQLHQPLGCMNGTPTTDCKCGNLHCKGGLQQWHYTAWPPLVRSPENRKFLGQFDELNGFNLGFRAPKTIGSVLPLILAPLAL